MKTHDHAEQLAEALKSLLEHKPTIEPSKNLPIAHRNWELFEQGRQALAAWERHNETTKGTK